MMKNGSNNRLRLEGTSINGLVYLKEFAVDHRQRCGYAISIGY
ncbi:MAG: hypothetical protein ACRCZY_09630 [Phocaeicola sp.]